MQVILFQPQESHCYRRLETKKVYLYLTALMGTKPLKSYYNTLYFLDRLWLQGFLTIKLILINIYTLTVSILAHRKHQKE